MQELEKILEEIDIKITQSMWRKREGLFEAENIIRKHMNDNNLCGECSRRKWYQIGYKDGKDDGWIPVDERLPENTKHKGTFCPKYQVDTKYGVTEGWYNPDVKSWYCLFWFMTKRYLQHEIDFKKGDAPEVVRVPLESDIVVAWRPLPEPYHPERSDNHDEDIL